MVHASLQDDPAATRAASSTRATDDHKQVLARLKAKAAEQPVSVSAAAEVQAELTPKVTAAPASAKQPALTTTCSTEFGSYGPAAMSARIVVSLKAAAQEEQRQVRYNHRL